MFGFQPGTVGARDLRAAQFEDRLHRGHHFGHARRDEAALARRQRQRARVCASTATLVEVSTSRDRVAHPHDAVRQPDSARSTCRCSPGGRRAKASSPPALRLRRGPARSPPVRPERLAQAGDHAARLFRLRLRHAYDGGGLGGDRVALAAALEPRDARAERGEIAQHAHEQLDGVAALGVDLDPECPPLRPVTRTSSATMPSRRLRASAQVRSCRRRRAAT